MKQMDEHPTEATVTENGVDRLQEYATLLEGKRLGLVTGPTGLDRLLHPTIDLLHRHFDLQALFSPEHGLYGEAQAGDHVDSMKDARTGLPVHSLYDATRDPDPETLQKLDALVFDMQDIGVRYYTFPYTLSHLMAVCARMDLPLIVLDRINPLGGRRIAGNLLHPAFASFVGEYPLPVLHGLTLGEFARWVNRETGMNCPLEVVPCSNWTRNMEQEETGLPWVMPSPNMPTPDTIRCYAGTCLFEGTNLSEGRGTTKPFELVGAPFLDAWSLADRMNTLSLQGVRFRPAFFRPTFSKHTGQLCQGVQIHIMDRAGFDGFRTGLLLLDVIRRMSPAFSFLEDHNGAFFLDKLAGTDVLRKPDFSPEQFLKSGLSDMETYKRERRNILLYPDQFIDLHDSPCP